MSIISPIVSKLNAEIVRILRLPEQLHRALDQGCVDGRVDLDEVGGSEPEQHQDEEDQALGVGDGVIRVVGDGDDAVAREDREVVHGDAAVRCHDRRRRDDPADEHGRAGLQPCAGSRCRSSQGDTMTFFKRAPLAAAPVRRSSNRTSTVGRRPSSTLKLGTPFGRPFGLPDFPGLNCVRFGGLR